MRLLLDTHVFLWWDRNDSRLPAAFRDAIGLPENEVFVSAGSAWEIAIKRTSGKLEAGASAAATIRRTWFWSCKKFWPSDLDNCKSRSERISRMSVSVIWQEDG